MLGNLYKRFLSGKIAKFLDKITRFNVDARRMTGCNSNFAKRAGCSRFGKNIMQSLELVTACKINVPNI